LGLLTSGNIFRISAKYKFFWFSWIVQQISLSQSDCMLANAFHLEQCELPKWWSKISQLLSRAMSDITSPTKVWSLIPCHSQFACSSREFNFLAVPRMSCSGGTLAGTVLFSSKTASIAPFFSIGANPGDP
jgi:hypothetical protein